MVATDDCGAGGGRGAERDRIQALVETRSRMEEIYRAKRPEKIKDIIPLLAEWEGEEHVLLSKIEAKYKC